MSFTLERGSPSLLPLGATPSDIFTSPGPIGGPPVLALTGAMLGLLPADNIDAMSWGPQPHMPPIFFSVDPFAAGTAGTAVSVESLFGQAAGDIYTTVGAGGNMLGTNQDMSGLVPALPPAVPGAMPPIDDIDSLNSHSPALISAAAPIAFSLDAASPTLGLIGAGPEDILISFPGFGIPVMGFPGGALGLGPGDDIDALIWDAALPLGPPPIFSLAPGGPTVTAPLSPDDPGDLLFMPGAPFIVAPAAGLLAAPVPGPGGDNLNAATVIPIPPAVWLFVSALGMLGWTQHRAR